MNSCVFVGRVGNDAELKSTSSGTSLTKFSLAVDRPKKGGEKQDPIWVRVTLWGKQAESLAQYITKGKQIAVSGEIDLRTYETSSGEERTDLTLNANRVTLLGGGAEKQRETVQPEINEDDIPF